LQGGNITSKDDPRVIPFGKFLRKYKINELPQLVNVLIGDMSIIGRRPTVMEHFDFFNSSTKKIIAKLKPGLSGISSIVFRDEEIFFTAVSNEDNSKIYSREIAPFKGELEIWYFNNQSIIVDIVLLILTIISIIKPASNFHNYFFKDLPKHSIFNPG
jgi:lipopolysaccharide/colanic/teichoic acid biosynthesis glycosyltransferase